MKIPFPANLEKDGRIKVPQKLIKEYEIEYKELLYVEIERHVDINRNFVAEAFKEAIQSKSNQ